MEPFSREQLVAEGDTTFEDFGRILASYYVPPANYFDFVWIPEEPKVFVKFVPRKLKWYQKRSVNFGAGVLAAALVVFLIK